MLDFHYFKKLHFCKNSKTYKYSYIIKSGILYNYCPEYESYFLITRNILFFKTFRMGPLVRAWCMRFEAKHHYFKKLSTVIGNYTNLPFTLAMRHQQWLCYQLQSANHESGFLEKGVEVGPGTGSMLFPLTVIQIPTYLITTSN